MARPQLTPSRLKAPDSPLTAPVETLSQYTQPAPEPEPESTPIESAPTVSAPRKRSDKPTANPEWKRTSVQLPPEVHKRLKNLATDEDLDMRDLILEAIEDLFAKRDGGGDA
jgi:hypothetical protein